MEPVILDKEQLNRVCRVMQPVLASKSEKIGDSLLMLRARGDRLDVFASNGVLNLATHVAMQNAGDFHVAINGSRFLKAVNSIDTPTVACDVTDGGFMCLKYGSVSTKLSVMDPLHKNTSPEVETSLSVSAVEFENAVTGATRFASKNDARAILKGVLVNVEPEGAAKVTATDGRMLFHQQIQMDVQAAVPHMAAFVVPLDTALELLRVVQHVEPDRHIHIGVTESAVVFRYQNVSVWSQTLYGKYPDVQGVIPKTCALELTVASDPLLRFTRAVCALSREESLALGMSLDKQLFLNANLLDGEEMNGVVDVRFDPSQWVKMNVLYNSKILMNAVDALKCQSVVLEYTGPNQPLVLRDPAQRETKVVMIMPLHQR